MFTKEHIKSKITYYGDKNVAGHIKCTTEEQFIKVVKARCRMIENKYWRGEHLPNQITIGLNINGSNESYCVGFRTMCYDIEDVIMELFEGISVTGFSVCIDGISVYMVDEERRCESFLKRKEIERNVNRAIFNVHRKD